MLKRWFWLHDRIRIRRKDWSRAGNPLEQLKKGTDTDRGNELSVKRYSVKVFQRQARVRSCSVVTWGYENGVQKGDWLKTQIYNSYAYRWQVNHRSSPTESLEPQKGCANRTWRTLRERQEEKGQSSGERLGMCADLESKRRDSFKDEKMIINIQCYRESSEMRTEQTLWGGCFAFSHFTKRKTGAQISGTLCSMQMWLTVVSSLPWW